MQQADINLAANALNQLMKHFYAWHHHPVGHRAHLFMLRSNHILKHLDDQGSECLQVVPAEIHADYLFNYFSHFNYVI